MAKNNLEKWPDDSDGDSLRLLVENGSDVTSEMEIDFALAVPDEARGLACSKAATALGYKTSVGYDEQYKRWTCYCSKLMIPLYESLIREQKTLGKLGIEFQAKPDGWGTFGNAP